jgi:hypothetical protein
LVILDAGDVLDDAAMEKTSKALRRWRSLQGAQRQSILSISS